MRVFPAFAAWLVAGSLLGTACQDEELENLRPDLRFVPKAIDFGARALDRAHISQSTAFNRGTASLEVLEVRVEPSHAPFQVTAHPSRLEVGASEEVQVVFSPWEQGESRAAAVFVIDLDGTTEVKLPLSGEVGPPLIEVEPAALSFGTVNQDEGETLALSVRNVGNDWLVLQEASLADADSEFSIDPASPALPLDIAPDGREVLFVRYVPRDMGPDQDTLELRSNADNGPVTEVPLDALANLSPVARAFEVSSGLSEVSVDPLLTLTLSAEGTYDPEGGPVTLRWQLIERPPGSQSALSATAATQTQIHLDLVGDYVARLQATDSAGASGYADVNIHAIRDLVLRLRWQAAAGAPCRVYDEDACAAMSPTERANLCCDQTDVDLHLVAPGGTLGDYQGSCPERSGCNAALCACVDPTNAACAACPSDGSDCAYANRQPDWGTPGDPLDDPRLDLDDVRGRGPEIISLNNPADGVYQVQVHFCNDRVGEPTEAVVEIFIEGALRSTLGPQVLAVQGQVWLAATLTRANESWSVVDLDTVGEGPADLCAR